MKYWVYKNPEDKYSILNVELVEQNAYSGRNCYVAAKNDPHTQSILVEEGKREDFVEELPYKNTMIYYLPQDHIFDNEAAAIINMNKCKSTGIYTCFVKKQ